MPSRYLVVAIATALLVWVTPASAGSLTGHWVGQLQREGQALPISFDFEDTPAGLAGRFSAPTWRVLDYPLGEVSASADRLHFKMGDTDVFDGTVQGDSLTGSFKEEDGQGTFVLHRAPAQPLSYDAIPVTFRNGDVALSGTLCLPRTKGPLPAAVLVHGSGPEVRWGTSRYVADRLARAGVAALIYDKRGSGQSGGDWKTASYEDLADDAIAGAALLAARPEIDPKRIGVIGHSQGGIVGPLAATRAPGRFAFIVAEDTVAGPVWKQDIYRVKSAIGGLHLPSADEAKAMKIFSLFVDVARGLKPYAELQAASAPYVKTSWYDWLGIPPHDAWVWAWYRKTGSYDTLPTWRQVHASTLLVYGEKDALLPVSSSIAEIEAALDVAGAPYTALIAPGAEHNLTIHPKVGGPFFWWREAPGLVDLIVDWVKASSG